MKNTLTHALLIGATLFCFSCGENDGLGASGNELAGSCTPGASNTCYCSDGTTSSHVGARW